VANLIVVRNEIDGWDVVREDDPQALSNHPDKRTAIAAAELRIKEEGEGRVEVHEQESHGVDDSTRGMKAYFLILLGLLLVAGIVIVITSLLASWTGI